MKIWYHLKTSLNCPFSIWYLSTGTFDYRTRFNHSKTGLFWYSDACCKYNLKNLVLLLCFFQGTLTNEVTHSIRHSIQRRKLNLKLFLSLQKPLSILCCLKIFWMLLKSVSFSFFLYIVGSRGVGAVRRSRGLVPYYLQG